MGLVGLESFDYIIIYIISNHLVKISFCFELKNFNGKVFTSCADSAK